MKKRLEEKLAMLAFGDMSPEETLALENEALADPDAGKALAEYRRMRDDLKAMAEVPPHQLSTERLRNAILTQGLKPKNRPAFGWMWMPAAACVLAFALVAVRNMRAPGDLANFGAAGSVASFENDPDSIFLPKPDVNLDFNAARTASNVFEGASVQPSLAMSSTSFDRGTSDGESTAARPRQHSSSRVEALKAEVAARFDEEINTMDAFGPARGPVPAPPMAFAARGSESTQDQPILVIESSKDAATGASKAKEVDSPGNVVVGG